MFTWINGSPLTLTSHPGSLQTACWLFKLHPAVNNEAGGPCCLPVACCSEAFCLNTELMLVPSLSLYGETISKLDLLFVTFRTLPS